MTKARTNADNASADIQGVTAGTGLSGGGTSGTVTLTNDMATTIAAKGDLVVGTGNDTYAALTAGNSGDTLVADSSTTTGLRWQADWNTGKNKIINGDFEIWQRGTSFTPAAAGVYTADRWMIFADGTGGTRTVSRQSFTPGNAITGYEPNFFLRYATTVAPSGQSYNNLTQRIEDVRTFAGQTVTLSFWAKGDAARTMTLQIHQNFGSGGSTEVYTAITPGWSTTTSWTRFTHTFTVPSISGKTVGTSSFLGIQILLPTSGTYTLEFWGIQLEGGSVATPFTTATGTFAGELAACQRYYYRTTGADTGASAYSPFAVGLAYLTTEAAVQLFLPVKMRRTPTSVDFASLQVTDFMTNINVTSLALNQQNANNVIVVATVASGLTQYRPYHLVAANTTAGYVGLSAEL